MHHKDKEVALFATSLLDNVEDMKANDPALNTDEAAGILADDDTAQAYIEAFATKVFVRADNEIQHQQTTRATPQKLLAAAQFFDLLHVFKTELDADVNTKIKYAKFHAARIIKAYKNGEDPNEYAPPPPKEDDDELAELESGVVDDDSNINANDENGETGENDANADNDNGLSLPSAPAAPDDPRLPPPPPDVADDGSDSGPTFDLPSAPPAMPKVPDMDATELPDIPQAPSRAPHSTAPPPAPSRPARRSSGTSTSSHAAHAKHITKDDIKHIMDESEVVSSAQKHAKFAISALNYDDIDTAVKELKNALSLLENYGG